MVTLGKYELHEKLGRGGFGTVYRAMDTSLGREVALKVLHPELTIDREFVDRFRQEAKTLALLDDRNIVTIHEINEENGRIYIAMRYLPGGSLRNLIEEKGRIQFTEAVKIITQVASGLSEAHKRGVIHRDIKPENIVFDSHHEAILTDFGLVRGESTETPMAVDNIMGTPSYIAPEIWDGEKATAASDEYALGCVFYEMITGKRLFDGKTIPEIMKKHVGDYSIYITYPEDIPVGVREVISKAIEKDPQKRYGSVLEFAEALARQTVIRNLVKNPQKDKFHLASKLFLWIKNKKNVLFMASREQGNKKKLLFYVGIPVLSIVIALISLLVTSPKLVINNLYYSTNITGNRNLYVLYGNRSSHQVTYKSGNIESWHPYNTLGGRIFFTSNRSDGKAEIYSMDNDGIVIQKTNTPGKFESWSPALDSYDNLYFVSNRAGGKAEIYLMNRKGIVKKVTSTKASYESWDPTPIFGGNIYFTSNRAQGKAEIFRMDSRGNIEQVTSTTGFYASWDPTPAWGENLYFTSDRAGGQTEIYKMDKKGHVTRITFSPPGKSSWNPIPAINGSLYFTSNRDNKIKIYQLDTNGKTTEVAYAPGNIEGMNASASPQCN